MKNIISRSITTIKQWWIFLLSGALIAASGLYVFYAPIESYKSLAWLFSVLILVNGFSNAFFSVSNRSQINGWGWYLTGGVFEIILGILLVYYPNITLVMLPVFVGFWLLYRGINLIGTAFELKKLRILNWGWFLLFGTALIYTALSMILLPVIGHLTVLILTGLGLLILGISNFALALKLRKIKSLTIDKVNAVKKDLKSSYQSLKKQIISGYNHLSEENQKKIDTAIKTYEARS